MERVKSMTRGIEMYKIYYIMHSCFLVELSDRYLLFDYFDKNVIGDVVQYHGSLPQLDADKYLYVFASHSHKDHWWLECLRWADSRDNIKFILSKDIRLGRNYLTRNGFDLSIKDKIQFVTSMKKYKVDDMEIETLRSTDAGVAFAIKVGDKSFYHAGDLNWWNAEGRGELFGEVYGREYKRALKAIINRHFDAAFVVLDSRMGEDGYFLGMEYFVQKIECDNIFPMHTWGDYKWIKRFKERPSIANLKDRIVDIDQENMLFEIED